MAPTSCGPRCGRGAAARPRRTADGVVCRWRRPPADGTRHLVPPMGERPRVGRAGACASHPRPAMAGATIHVAAVVLCCGQGQPFAPELVEALVPLGVMPVTMPFVRRLVYHSGFALLGVRHEGPAGVAHRRRVLAQLAEWRMARKDPAAWRRAIAPHGESGFAHAIANHEHTRGFVVIGAAPLDRGSA